MDVGHGVGEGKGCVPEPGNIIICVKGCGSCSVIQEDGVALEYISPNDPRYTEIWVGLPQDLQEHLTELRKRFCERVENTLRLARLLGFV